MALLVFGLLALKGSLREYVFASQFGDFMLLVVVRRFVSHFFQLDVVLVGRVTWELIDDSLLHSLA